MVQINDAYQKMMASVASAKIDAHETQTSTTSESSRPSNRDQQSRSPKAHQGPEARAHGKYEEHAQQKTEENARHRQQEEEKRKREEKMKERRGKQREEDRQRRKEESQRRVFERLKTKGRGRGDVQGLAHRVWSTLEEEYGGGLRPGPGDNRRTLPRTKDQLSLLLSHARATHSAMFLLQGLSRKVQAAVLKDLTQQGSADSFCFATLKSVLSQVIGGLAMESPGPVLSETDRLRKLFQQERTEGSWSEG